jgi:MFS transporter, OFA family, oxalate/formate antiporter
MIARGARAELKAGWPILIACAVGVGCSPIALPFYAIGPLTKPIAADLGWLRSEIQFAIVFSSGIGALSAPVTGWMVDRFGPRAVALPSLAGVTLGLLMASMATTLYAFWAGFALAALLGAGANPVLWSRVIAGSFEQARGAALGLALVGTALVALILPAMIAAIEPEHGWRTALRFVAALPVLVALPVVAGILRTNAAKSPRIAPAGQTGVTLNTALRDYRFWALTASILCAYLAISGAAPNLVPVMTDKGMTTAAAAGLAGAYAISMVPGRILAGALMDRFWAPGVACAILLLPCAACFILIGARDPVWLVVGCGLLGIAAGAELDVLAFMTARYFGLAHYSKIYAISYMALATGSAAAPTLFSRIQEATGSYASSLTIAAALFGAAALFLLLLGRYPDFHAPTESRS